MFRSETRCRVGRPHKLNRGRLTEAALSPVLKTGGSRQTEWRSTLPAFFQF